MSYEWIIIDGYSLMHRDGEFAEYLSSGNIALGRQMLIRKVERAALDMGQRVTVVFDGDREGGPGDDFETSPVDVVYSPSHLTADSVIERMVHSHKGHGEILVVTSDRLERITVSASGAHTMSCGDFIDVEKKVSARRRQTISYKKRSFSPGKLGDLFP